MLMSCLFAVISFSNISSLSRISLCISAISRSFTKISMMRILICIAFSLLSTFASMSIPCSVNAYGRKPPKCCLEGIAFCDTIRFTSSSDSWNMKFGGKRPMFLLTCSLSRMDFTPYNSARSRSYMIFLLRSINILLMTFSSGNIECLFVIYYIYFY